MGKRSNFQLIPRNYYPTPYSGVKPLLPFLEPGTKFDEPCCGNGALIAHLEQHGHICNYYSDIEPDMDAPAIDVFMRNSCNGDMFITNPPWDREILHPLIDHLTNFAPAWLLFDSDWAHTIQSRPYMPHCKKIVSVGRVKWFPDTKQTGKDNCAWYLFDKSYNGPTTFHGR